MATPEKLVGTSQDHERLVHGLLRPGAWPGVSTPIRRIDTHISTVLIAGDNAFKIKKPLDLGFLHYEDIEQRRIACQEEVRLNRRLAPQIYLRSVPITGDIDHPGIGGKGGVIDWAVHMHAFDPHAVLSENLGALSRGLIERIARQVARFHRDADVAGPNTLYGTPEAVVAPMLQNFSQMRSRRGGDRQSLDQLSDWTETRYRELRETLYARKAGSHIRECHGDLHLGNIALVDGAPVIFDGIEFDPNLRWIDTASDLAFLTMDLTYDGQVGLSRWLLDCYLTLSGDFEALRVLHFYEAYRAMVRAKVIAIRMEQRDLDTDDRVALLAEFRRYLRNAESYTRPAKRALIITHGVAASGKSTLSGSLIDRMSAIRIRSDVERKRLAGLDPYADTMSRFNAGLYNADMTERTYRRMAERAELILESGFACVVDATFLQESHRRLFFEVAQSQDVPFIILSCDAPEPELRARMQERMEAGLDPSEATPEVLEQQLQARQPLAPDEWAFSIPVGPDHPLELEDLVQRLG